MPSPASHATIRSLRALDVGSLPEHVDDAPARSVRAFLDEAVDVVAEFLAGLGVTVETPPNVAFDPLKRGATFDPRPSQAAGAPRLVVGAPRERPIGGYAVLAGEERTGPSVLGVLCDGLVWTANQELASRFFEAYDLVRESTADEVVDLVDAAADSVDGPDAAAIDRPDTDGDDDAAAIPATTALYAEYLGRERPGVLAALERRGGAYVPDGAATVRLFDPRTRTVAPAVDAAFARSLEFYVGTPRPDPDLRADYLDAWVDWYRERGSLDASAFRLVARSAFARIDATVAASAERRDPDASAAGHAAGATEVAVGSDGAERALAPEVRAGLERALALRRPLLAEADLSALDSV